MAKIKSKEKPRILIESTQPFNLVVVGIPSKTEYRFSANNRQVLVYEEDVPDLLSKLVNGGRVCCGQTGKPGPLFKIV